MSREDLLQHAEDRQFDLIVIGGGINGAGVARDASMRGLRVLLLDKGDLASGTTQWATRLIHGGLRYLEHYEVPLVRESLRDRETLLRIAPHLVKPLRFAVPVYEHSSHGPGMIRLGMIGYDVLSYDRSVPGHKMYSVEQALEEYPGLNPEGLKAVATYSDCQVEYAERVAVENAMSAVQNGAEVITYAEVKHLLFEDSGTRVAGVQFEDKLNGGGTYTVRAPVTVNVAGPWVDRVLGDAEASGSGNGQTNGDEQGMIGGTKGSHLVVDPFPGAPKTAVYVEARADGRPYFIVPWNERYLIGTTDRRYEGDLDYVEADQDEIDYLLDETNFVIPEANLTRDSVLFTYSGVRPLPSSPQGDEGSVSRSHIVYDHAKGKAAAGGSIKASGGPKAEGLLSIIGGKLTTYRNLGRQTTDVVYKKLGVKTHPKSATERVPLPGGKVPNLDGFEEEFRMKSGLPDVLARRLVKVYGARAYDVLAEAGDDESLKEPLTPSEPAVETGLMGCEILYAFRHELAQKLDDVLLRRTMIAYGPEVGLDVDEAAARVCVKHLGWSQDRAKKEVEDFRKWIKRYTPKAMKETQGASVSGGAE